MLRRVINFTDYNGNPCSEEFRFNLSKAELAELEMDYPGGFTATVQRIAAEKNGKEILAVFKDLISRSYGVKSLDGRQFIKNDEVREKFMQSEAYSELFMELVTDPEAASAFMTGIIPAAPAATPEIPAE